MKCTFYAQVFEIIKKNQCTCQNFYAFCTLSNLFHYLYIFTYCFKCFLGSKLYQTHKCTNCYTNINNACLIYYFSTGCMVWQTNMFAFKNTLSVQNKKWWLWNVFRSMEMWVKYNLNNSTIDIAQLYARGSHLRASQKVLRLFEWQGHRLLIISHQVHSDLHCSRQTSRPAYHIQNMPTL
jgi:hypothetical protein